MECFKLHLMFSLKRSSKFFLFFVFLNSFLRVIGGEGVRRTHVRLCSDTPQVVLKTTDITYIFPSLTVHSLSLSAMIQKIIVGMNVGRHWHGTWIGLRPRRYVGRARECIPTGAGSICR
jgi:hypothetical protein